MRVATDGQTRPDQERESVDISRSHNRTDLDGWLDETETYTFANIKISMTPI